MNFPITMQELVDVLKKCEHHIVDANHDVHSSIKLVEEIQAAIGAYRPPLYALVAYCEDWYDSRHDERFSSQFEYHEGLTLEELVQKGADLKVREHFARGIDFDEIIVIQEGYRISGIERQDGSHIVDLFEDMFRDAARPIIEQRDESIAAKKREETAQAVQAEKDRKYQEYLALKAQFEGQASPQ